jgi:N-hydroxyarylamine O-acetyltransferase
MSEHLSLDAYFDRIRYGGSTAPTLQTLNALAAAHAKAIPFENLDVLLGRRVLLDPDAVSQKLVHERRGGYCFEQNSLFLRVLCELGFQATPIGARVRLQRPREFTPPRTHMLLRVELAGASWLADVGVGALSLTAAVRLDAAGEQPTPHEPRRIICEHGRYFHQARLGDTWSDVYEFTLEEMPEIDREVANWYTSTHPASHFRSSLVAARAADDGARVTLSNRELTLRPRSGTAHKQWLRTPAELLQALAEYFQLRFPEGTVFDCPALDFPNTR